MPRSHLVVPLITVALACAEPQPWETDPLAEPQAISLFGDSLWARVDTTGAVAEADSALAADPGNVDLMIAAGRVRRNFWQYRQAMALYTRAMELDPGDWRPYRFRGHRHISTRDFGRAIVDLEMARELAPHNWDVAYHLGLAYYLSGRFADAAAEYTRCLDLADDPQVAAVQSEGFRGCTQNATDPESRVAMVEWAVRALRRSGDRAGALRLLASVPNDLPISENLAYYHTLLMYKGAKTADELLELGDDAPYRLETVGYGVANWLLLEGDSTRAMAILEQVAAHEWWPGFGRIAAEVELRRLGR